MLTTRELAQLIRMRGLDLREMPPDTADTPFGERTTAGKLFGASGGVMEAAIRTAYHLVTGKELEKLEVPAVRGLEGVKEARVQIDGIELGVAVVTAWATPPAAGPDPRRPQRPALHRGDDLSRRLHRRRRAAASGADRERRPRADAGPVRHRRPRDRSGPRTTTRPSSDCIASFSASRWAKRATICCTRITPGARCRC